MKRSEYSEAEIVTILRRAEGHVPVPPPCREHGMMSDALFYTGARSTGAWTGRWSSSMTSLEREHRDLRKMDTSKNYLIGLV